MFGALLLLLHWLCFGSRRQSFRPHGLGPYRTAAPRAAKRIRRRPRFRRMRVAWRLMIQILLWLTEPFVLLLMLLGLAVCAGICAQRAPIPEPEPTTPPPSCTMLSKRSVIWVRVLLVDPPCACVQYSTDEPEIWIELVFE
jgi:hypothetical protein